MNQSLYRIVFNKARGCMMAVSEIASSHSKGKDKAQSASSGSGSGSTRGMTGSSPRFGQDSAEFGDSSPFGFSKPVVKAINSFVLVAMLVPSLTAPLSAYAQVISDPNAPGKERPTVLNTANGLPQVNIQTPSAKGVSRNKYSRFDVDGRGIIINNSRTNTQTNIGGLVQGNPWLAKGSARIIVNEVNSSNPSYLNGYIEIAGERAEIIIANPAGISINGGGFINASSATLTTGTPIINDGGLEGYSVQKGTISINGYGLDASLTDYTGILARAVEVNAGIWANNLQIVTGANQVSADQSTSTPIAGVGGAPMFALDVSNLGGMYAGKITLVGTEAGLGVRNAGYLGASGDLSINSEGILVNSGLINSGGNANLSIKGSVDNSGAISATGNATINSPSEIRNSGGISAGGNLGLTSGSTVTNSGSLTADGNVSVASATGITNSGQIYAGGNTTLTTGGDILNSGMVAAQGNTSLTSTAVGGNITNTDTSVVAAGLTPDGQLLGTGDLTLVADGKVAVNGVAAAGNALNIDSGSLDIAGINLTTGALALNAKKGDLDATGATINVSRELDLKAAQTLKTDAAAISAGSVALSANAWSNVNGQILQVGTADTTITIANKIDNTGGYIATNGNNLTITSASLDNTKGDILHAGSGTLNLRTSQLGMTEGNISGNGSVNLTASSIDGAKGVLVSKNDMQIAVTGDINLAEGQIGAGGKINLSAASLNVNNGQVTSESDLNLQVTNAINSSKGLIASNKTVTIASGALSNDSGTIAGSAVDINTHGQTLSSVSGTIASSSTLNINSGALNNDKGSIQSAGNMVIATNGQTLTNTHGDATKGIGILSQGTLSINSGDINNDAGYLAAAGATTLDAKNISNTSGTTGTAGIIVSGDALTIKASGDINNTSGQIQAAKDLSITTQGNLDSTKGLIATATKLDLDVGKTLTTDSAVVSAETLGIKAQDWSNVKGQVIQTGTADTSITVAGALNNNEGYIASNANNLSISSASLNSNLGNILHAGTGQATVTTGKLELTEGQIASNGDLTLSASQIDGKKGSIVSKGAMQLDVTGAADLSDGQIGAGKDLTVNAGSLNISNGQATSQTNLTLTVTGAVDANKALIAANNDVTLKTGALNNKEGKIAGNKVDVNTTTQNLDNSAGTIASSTTLTINSGVLTNDAGSIQAGGDMVIDTNGQALTNTGGNPEKGLGILSQGTLTLNSGALDNNGGYIAASKQVTITASSVSNNTVGTGTTAVKGTIISNDELKITTTTGDLSNVGGQIQSTKKLSLDVKSALDNTQGLIATSADIDIKAASIVNKNTKIETTKDKLDANGQPVIDLATDKVVQETKYDIKGIQAKNVKLTAGNIDNTDGGIIAADDLTVKGTGSLNNTKGMLAAGAIADITATSLNNSEGVVQSTKALNLNVGTGVLDNTKGLIASSADIDIRSGTLINKDTKTESLVNKIDPDTKLVVKDAADNPVKETKLDIKGIQAKNVTLSTGAIDNTNGGILASETLNIASTGLLNNTKGMLAASETATIGATGVNNTQGTIQSAKTLSIDVASGTVNNTQGLIASSTDVTITADTIVNANTKTETVVGTETKVDIKGIQGKTVTLNANNVNNTEGGILAIDSLLIKGAGVVNNTKGMLSSTGDLVIKDTAAVDDPAPLPAGSPAPTTPAPETNIASKTQTVINTGGAIVANKKLTIDSKSLTGDGNILNAGTLVDVMQDTSGKQVKKNAAGKWVNVVDGAACSTATGCTEVADANVSVRKVDKDGVLLKKGADGKYIKVEANGTPILVNGAVVVVADADVKDAKEMTEGDITIKLIDTFTQTDKGSIQANGNLDMRTKGDVVNAGLIQASRALTLQAVNIDNKATGEISAGATQLAANGSITNRGLIDGSFTLLQANEITNTGTGRIYGDQVSILAGSLTNSAENGKAATIAARQRLDIGAYAIYNQDGALLLSLGDMAIGKELDASGKATGQAEAFINSSATVEVMGNLNISAKSLNNIDGYATTGSSTTSEDVVKYTIVSPGNPNDKQVFYGKDGTFKDWNNDPSNPEYAMFYSTLNSDPNNYLSAIGSSLEWVIERYTHTKTTTGSYGNRPANISVGGNMTTDFVDGLNDKSKIIVGGNLSGNGVNFQNIGSYGSYVDSEMSGNPTMQRTWVDQGCNLFGCGDIRVYDPTTVRNSTDITDYWQNPAEILYNTVPTIGNTVGARNEVVIVAAQPKVVAATVVAGQEPTTVTSAIGTATIGTNNTVTGGKTVNGVGAVTKVIDKGTVTATGKIVDVKPKPDPTGKVVRSGNSTTAQLPNNSLYIIQPVDSKGNPKGYLVETDPRFTQNKPWLGSDYMLQQMGYDPATQTKRLGDGFYEQKLIREQIADLTGRRFLDEYDGEQYANDEEQYKALMNAGIQFGQDYGLRVGIALTAEQMAKLTTDIVWLVEKEVTLPDGTKTKALVPQVYALVKPGDIDGSGNLLSAKSIDLKLKGDMVNSGLMAARGNLSIDAANITNLTGTIKGLDVSLVAAQDIQSIQGNISAGNTLKIGAGNDVVIKGGAISAGGSASITAGNDLLLIAQDKGRQVSGNFGKRDKDGKLIDPNDKSNSFSYGTYDQTGVNINVGGNLNLSAGRDFFAQGTQVNAGGGVNISAGRDASVTTALKGSSYDYNRVTTTRNGIFGKQTRTITTRETDLTNTASNINAGAANGGSANITAGRDLTLQGTNINAAGINLSAGNNVNVLAAYDVKEKTDINSLKSNFKGGSTTNIELDKKAMVSNLNGGNGAVNITAGNTITLEGTLITGASFTPIAQKTNLLAAMDTKTTEHSKTSNNLVWQSTQSKGTTNQVMHLTNINVPVGMSNFKGAGGITVQLPKNASLTEQITSLAKQPGNEYLTDLAKRSDIDWQRVEVINKSWDYKKEGLTPAASIVIAIVVAIATAGQGAALLNSLGGTVAGTTAGGAITATGLGGVATAATATTAATFTASTAGLIASAVVTTVATQATLAVINNKGDIGAALKELGSKENLKATLISAVTAGLLDKLGGSISFDIGGKETFLNGINAKSPFVAQLGANLINGVASSLVTTAINGGNVEDALKNAIKGAIINTAGASLSNGIGDLRADGKLDLLTGNLAHAILGCGMGAATTGNSSGCAAGAGGALVGHLGAELYDTILPGASKVDIANFAKVTTALTGLVTGQDVTKMNIAMNTSNNAVVNNYLNHKQWGDFAKDIAVCKAKATGCSASEEKAIKASYQDVSTKQNIALANCEATKNCDALKAEVALGTLTMLSLTNNNQLPIGGAVGNDLGQSIGQRLANDAAYRKQVNESIAVLNNCNANPSQCTQQAIKAAAIVVFPLLGVAGVGVSAASIGWGGSIGAAGNVAGQKVAIALDPTKEFNYTDVAMGAATGALTYGAALWPSLFVNTGGAVVTSAVNGSSPADTGGSLIGAAAGTGVGFAAGAGAQALLDKALNPWYREIWKETVLTIQSYVKPSIVPAVGGTMVGGVVQEGTNCAINCTIPQKPTPQVKK